MDISTRIEFAAPPAQVYAMMTDQAYLDEVCRATDSSRYEAGVSGSTTTTSRTFPAPDQVARFTGADLTVSEETTWDGAAGDGPHTGQLRMSVKGQPVSMTGQVTITAGGRGSLVELTGELKVSIPLLGRKIEQQTAPVVLAGFQTQQQVGDRWLAR